MRDLIVIIDAHRSKVYHLGFGKTRTRSNLAKANEKHNYRIFEDFAYYMIDLARKKLANDDFEIEGKVYASDSSTIDLYLSVFWWVSFRKAKGGIKLHTLYDITIQIPAFIHITPASVHDVNAMDVIPYQTGAYYIFDGGYSDFERLYRIQALSAFFVVRTKTNLKFNRMYSNKVDRQSGLVCDQIGKLSGFYVSKDYPEKLRRIKFYDAESSRYFVYLTNNMDLKSEEIVLLYKNR